MERRGTNYPSIASTVSILTLLAMMQCDQLVWLATRDLWQSRMAWKLPQTNKTQLTIRSGWLYWLPQKIAVAHAYSRTPFLELTAMFSADTWALLQIILQQMPHFQLKRKLQLEHKLWVVSFQHTALHSTLLTTTYHTAHYNTLPQANKTESVLHLRMHLSLCSNGLYFSMRKFTECFGLMGEGLSASVCPEKPFPDLQQ